MGRAIGWNPNIFSGGGTPIQPISGLSAMKVLKGIETYTKLMFHGDSIKDVSSSGITLTDTGIAFTDGKFNKAWNFDGSKYLYMPHNALLNLTGDFTFDFWLKSGAGRIISWGNAGGSVSFDAAAEASGKLYAYIQNGGTEDVEDKVPGNGIWVHIEINRSNGTLRLFVDGILVDSISSSRTCTINAPFRIGASRDSGYLTGAISEFRFSNGIARHTKDFTPMRWEYSDIDYVGLSWLAMPGYNVTIYRNTDGYAFKNTIYEGEDAGGYRDFVDVNENYYYTIVSKLGSRVSAPTNILYTPNNEGGF